MACRRLDEPSVKGAIERRASSPEWQQNDSKDNGTDDRSDEKDGQRM